MSKDYVSYREEIIQGISNLVQIPTLYDAASISSSMPYGKKVYEGYEWLKQLALSDGFEVLEFDGHALAIRIKENIAKIRIDVVSHVDVVEPCDGWSENPFSGRISSDDIYGRGTQDMKGALILTYYALKYIKDHQIPCNNEIRVVVGCDEERTMEDIRYYIKKSGEPIFAFTPDGKFPLSLGEMGAIMWCIEGSSDTCIEEFDGGVQCNVVSPIAHAILRDTNHYHEYQQELEKGYQGEVCREQERLIITIYGKAAHASKPEEGMNANVRLLELIQSVSKDALASKLYQCFYDCHGKGAGLNQAAETMGMVETTEDVEIAEAEVTTETEGTAESVITLETKKTLERVKTEESIDSAGKLALNLGILKIKNGIVSAQVDCRYPHGVTSEWLTSKMQQTLNPYQVQLAYDDKPTMTDLNSPYVQVLLNTYREVTKDNLSEPLISGGVTYSKVISNCVAFGPGLIDDVSLAHQKNERISMKRIDLLFELYTKTMIRLANQ